MKMLQSLVILSFFLAGTAVADETPRVVTVTAQGSVDVVPDMATVTLGVTSDGRTATAALAANNLAMDSVLARIEGAGIAPRDVGTSGFSLSPRWDNASASLGGAPRISGFVASNQVTVRVRDLNRLGTLLDELAADGANTFGGLTFGLSDPGPYEDEARKEAVAEARRKAKIYAQAAGVALGPLVSLSESGGYRPPAPMARMEMAMSAAAVPVAEGEVSVTASVTLVYEISD